MRTFVALLLCLSVWQSCSDKLVYDQTEKIPQSKWPMTQATHFAVNIPDTIQPYDLYFRISNGEFYPYSNLWLFCKTTAPGGAAHIDTLEIVLANVKGEWEGRSSNDAFVGLYEFKKKIKFPKAGQYDFLIVQGMRDSILDQVHEFGLVIEKNDE